MKKICSLLMLAAIAFSAQAETRTWWTGSEEMNVQSSTSGTWTIGLNLNVSGLTSILNSKDDTYSDNGHALFTVSGTGTHKTGWSRTEEQNQKMTVVLGWGANWYTSASTGVEAGLQLGMASGGNYKNLGTEGGGFGAYGAFDVYRADTKLQETDDWSISEDKKATACSLSQIASMTTIDKATLFITHTYAGGPEDQLADDPHRDYASDSGDYTKNATYTTFYLTVTGKLKDGTTLILNYMAQFNDESTFPAPVGSYLGGSSYYDVDMLTKIDNINTNLVDSMVFVNHAMDSASRAELTANGLPEPTTATLSLMALAALAARRRRR